MDKFIITSLIGSLILGYLYSGGKIKQKQDNRTEVKTVLRTHYIDSASFYWNSNDIRDISIIKNKYTSVVIADSFTYKAWSIDIQKYVAPFDTLDWCSMQIISYHKKG